MASFLARCLRPLALSSWPWMAIHPPDTPQVETKQHKFLVTSVKRAVSEGLAFMPVGFSSQGTSVSYPLGLGCHNKCHTAGGLNTRPLFLTVPRLYVCDQGAGEVRFR